MDLHQPRQLLSWAWKVPSFCHWDFGCPVNPEFEHRGSESGFWVHKFESPKARIKGIRSMIPEVKVHGKEKTGQAIKQRAKRKSLRDEGNYFGQISILKVLLSLVLPSLWTKGLRH